MSDIVYVDAAELTVLATRAFIQAGFPDADAAAAAEILVTMDRMGVATHGVERLGQYLKRVELGVVKARPDIRIEQRAPTLAIVDGDDGQGQVVGTRALDAALEMADAVGLAFVTVRNSNHFGGTAPYSLRAAEAGKCLFIGTTASPALAPFGGRDLMIGNNPLGFGAPMRGDPHFILDMAVSPAARGKMRALRDAKKPMPLGWALDADGNPTTDAAAGLAGFIQFIGGHKGYGLGLMVDILSGVLSGGRFLDDVGDMWAETEPQGSGHFFLTLDPIRLLGEENYFERMAAFRKKIKTCQPFTEGGEVLLPGEPEARAMAQADSHGIAIDTGLLEILKALAG